MVLLHKKINAWIEELEKLKAELEFFKKSFDDLPEILEISDKQIIKHAESGKEYKLEYAGKNKEKLVLKINRN